MTVRELVRQQLAVGMVICAKRDGSRWRIVSIENGSGGTAFPCLTLTNMATNVCLEHDTFFDAVGCTYTVEGVEEPLETPIPRLSFSQQRVLIMLHNGLPAMTGTNGMSDRGARTQTLLALEKRSLVTLDVLRISATLTDYGATVARYLHEQDD